MNWEKLITEITETGLSESKIADHLKKQGIQIDQSTINRIKNGTEPKHNVGEALRSLHDERVQKAA